MELGLSIVISSIIIAFVILYVNTRLSWNWKRIAVGGLVIPIAIIAIFLGYSYYSKIQRDKPQKQTKFLGLELGMTISDVKFMKGELEKVDDYYYRYNIDNDTEVGVGISETDKRVRYIALISSRSYANVQDIYIGDTYDKVIKKFGEPDDVSIHKSELKRTVSYPKYNTFFAFEKGVVSFIGIYNPDHGKMKYDEEVEKP